MTKVIFLLKYFVIEISLFSFTVKYSVMVKCFVNGREMELTKAAYEIARQYFGAVSSEDLIKDKPKELVRPKVIKPKELEEKPKATPKGDPKTKKK